MSDETRSTTPSDAVLADSARPEASGTDTRPEASNTATRSGAFVTTAPEASHSPDGPRVRWAGIIWGLVLAGIAAVVLWIMLDPANRDAVSEWWLSLTPTGMLLVAVVAVGGLLLVAGLAGLARRAARGDHA